MRKLIFVAFLLSICAVKATTFTEFYVQTTANNVNAGSTTSDSAAYTSTSGNWDGTSVFTPTDSTTPASSVNVGDWASVYINGATVAVYIARVLSIAAGANGAITLSTTAFGGTAPTSNSGSRSIKVGGAWKGPNTTDGGFPFGAIPNSALTNAANVYPRINFKNGVTYTVNAAMSQTGTGPVRFQGYTSSPGDLGRAVIDGGITGASYVVLSTSAGGANNDFVDFIFQHNGATGSAATLSAAGTEDMFNRVTVNSVRGIGMTMAALGSMVECETFLCNSNGATGSGFSSSSAGVAYIRCIAHNNLGASTGGALASASAIFIDCIFASNGANGLLFSAVTEAIVSGCDFYGNTGSGFDMSGSSAALVNIQNCNFIKNGAWGINSSGSAMRNGNIVNCGFGSGTQANTSGTIASVGGMNETGTITYGSGLTPWVDPTTGDFRINLTAAKDAGRGTFTQTTSSPGTFTGAIGYPDIGAAHHITPISTGGQKSSPFIR